MKDFASPATTSRSRHLLRPRDASCAPSARQGEFRGLAEAAQAADVLLDAIARSDGTRAVVVEELFNTRVTGGILGSFSFDQYGDITPATVARYSVRNGKVVVDGVVRVPSRPDN